ncbi:hypothetical protein OQA88_3264 [Cercophora sp. LCS_1]
MRLLNTSSLLFEEFFGEVGNGIPHYAILSHTWGPDEVSFRDHVDGVGPSRLGWSKVRDATKLANEEGFDYLWIDTCCIDKSSSAELSEAINSMFRWYRDAALCYAYLADVPSCEDPMAEDSSFSRSRWFTRGFTLQELLAPKEVAFVGADWAEIGTKKSLREPVSRITRIDASALGQQSWPEYSIAQKMSWAAGRRTTRLEDEAYCLLGLFNVNMPMLYGEGRRAFNRLQQEILRQSDDQSLFAWSQPEPQHSYTSLSGLFAPSPEHFRHASNVRLLPHAPGQDYETEFELVHQLVRMKLQSADGIEGLLLQPLQTEPALSNVIDARQAESASTTRESKPQVATTPPNNSMQKDAIQGEIEADGLADSHHGVAQQQNVQIPLIMIETDADAGIITDYGQFAQPTVRYLDNRIESTNDRADFEGPRRAGPSRTVEADSLSSGSPAVATLGPASWRWYIYEPVIVAPLRCQLDGRRLGILLSRDATGGGDGALSRLHCPSLIAVEEAEGLQLSTVTKYLRIASREKQMPQWRPWEAKPWPEIRISSALSSGYTLIFPAGPNWELEDKRGVLRPKNLYHAQHRANTTELAPLALFEGPPDATSSKGLDSISLFFLSIPTCDPGTLTVEVGTFRGRHAPKSSLDFQLYSCDLASIRHARIPLDSDRQSVMTLKYREGAGINCVNVSIDSWTGNIGSFPVLKSCEESETPWLTQRLFPILRSLRDGGSGGLQAA